MIHALSRFLNVILPNPPVTPLPHVQITPQEVPMPKLAARSAPSVATTIDRAEVALDAFIALNGSTGDDRRDANALILGLLLMSDDIVPDAGQEDFGVWSTLYDLGKAFTVLGDAA